MGGRSGASVGRSSVSKPIAVPKVDKKTLGTMERKNLETLATAIFANNASKMGMTKEQGAQRARDLMSGNTSAQLRKYILKHQ